MKINDHDLRQLNEERLQALLEKDSAALLQLGAALLKRRPTAGKQGLSEAVAGNH